MTENKKEETKGEETKDEKTIQEVGDGLELNKAETSGLPRLFSKQSHMLTIKKLNLKVQLHGLNMADIVELENQYNMPFTGIFPEGGRVPIERVMRVIWMSARKHGLTYEQIKQGERAFELLDVQLWFDLGDLTALGPIMDDILELSGFRTEDIERAKKGQAGEKTPGGKSET